MTAGQPKLPLGYRLLYYDSIGSTNDEAMRLARSGTADRTLVWALEQTAGRGRRGRTWISPRGNLYLSMILRPCCTAARAAELGFVAALGIGAALRALVPRSERVTYKWPNDVMLNGRKIAGVLLETETGAQTLPDFVVVGVGVNLAVSPGRTEFPATSIFEEGFCPVPPETMLAEFTHCFESWVTTWQSEGFAAVRAAWLAAAAIRRGEPIHVRAHAHTLSGRFIDIDEGGGLLLDCAEGCRRIAAGEVFPAA